jgi:hypothetical protein
MGVLSEYRPQIPQVDPLHAIGWVPDEGKEKNTHEREYAAQNTTRKYGNCWSVYIDFFQASTFCGAL